METSTPRDPVVQLHRVMPPQMGMSPLCKRAKGADLNISGLNLMDMPDEEQERSMRRQSLAMQRRVSLIHTNSGTPSSPAPLIQLTKAFNRKELEEHLTYCRKLYDENKITARNVWELHIIDVLKQIVRSKEANVLQEGAHALEIGAKVYSLRVDDLHRRALQLAGELTSMDARKQANADGDDNQEGDDDDGAAEGEKANKAKKKKKPTKRRSQGGKKQTIDDDGKHLFGTIRELEPVCFSTADDLDVGSFDNLFTLKQPIDPATNQLILLDKGLVLKNEEDIVKFPNDVVRIGLPKTTHAQLCIKLHGFSLTEWDPENELEVDEVVYDENGFPMAELDGSITNLFADEDQHNDFDVLDDVEEQRLRCQGDVAHVVDALPEESRRATEFGFNTLVKLGNGTVLDKLWAGPSHWKIKYVRPSKARFSGSVQAEPQRPHRRLVAEQSILNLAEMIEENKTLEIDFDNVVHPPTKLPADYVKITLPAANIAMYGMNPFELKVKESMRVPRKSTPDDSHDEQVPDNEDMQVEHSDDHSIGDMNNGFGEAPMQNDMEDNPMELVPEPFRVQSDYIAFAKQAKKMDMYKLKAAIWKKLKDDHSDDADKITEIEFNDVYNGLGQHLNAQMRDELSVHLAFVALLDLCNAHSLKLQPMNDQNVNFLITNGHI